MSTNINENILEVDNLSRGIQRMSTKFQKADGDVSLAVNADFKRIGGVDKITGYSKIGSDISTTSTSTTSSTTSSTSTSTSTSTSSSTSTSTSSSTSTTTGA